MTILGAALAPSAAFPSTRLPVTIDELVSRAAVIFVGEARARRSEWQWSGQGRSIVTRVTFKVERVLKGRTLPETELEFLGGEVGDIGMRVAGMPEFRVGDRDVLFVSGQSHAVSPLVGFSEGRFRIVRDAATGVDQIRAADGRLFAGPAPVLEPAGRIRPIVPFPSAQVVRPFSSAEFQAFVELKVAERAR